jgi:hypothetical protein
VTEGMTVEYASSREAAIEMVFNGRADIVMGPYMDIQPLIRSGRLKGLHVWPYAWANAPLYFTLNRRHVDLVPLLNTVLQDMAHEGLIERYHQEALQGVHLPPLRNDGHVIQDVGTDKGP